MNSKIVVAVSSAILSFASANVFANYTSAATQIDAQEKARQNAQQAVDRQVYHENFIAAIQTFANCHGGFAQSPTTGFDNPSEFSTHDGWECQTEGGMLECANLRLGKKFGVFNFPPNQNEGVSGIGDIEAVYGCFFKHQTTAKPKHSL